MEIKPGKVITEEIRKLDGWKLVGRELTKRYRCRDFSDGVRFIAKIAVIANRLDHHPDVLLSEFRTVRLFITTHEFGTITDKDIEFAKLADKQFAQIRRAWQPG